MEEDVDVLVVFRVRVGGRVKGVIKYNFGELLEESDF